MERRFDDRLFYFCILRFYGCCRSYFDPRQQNRTPYSFSMKKTFVLVVLFVLPIVAYLFFASGVNNFGRLPVLTSGVSELPQNEDGIMLQDHITVLGFWVRP